MTDKKTLTLAQQLRVVKTIGNYDKGVHAAYDAGNYDYVPVVTDSLELADMELAIEETLGITIDDFTAWKDVSTGSSLAKIFATAAAMLD